MMTMMRDDGGRGSKFSKNVFRHLSTTAKMFFPLRSFKKNVRRPFFFVDLCKMNAAILLVIVSEQQHMERGRMRRKVADNEKS